MHQKVKKGRSTKQTTTTTTTAFKRGEENDDDIKDLPTSSSSSSSLLSNLLQNIRRLSTNRSRCTAALRAMVGGQVAYVARQPQFFNNNNDDEDDGDDNVGRTTAAAMTSSSYYARNLAIYAASISGEDNKNSNSSSSGSGSCSTDNKPITQIKKYGTRVETVASTTVVAAAAAATTATTTTTVTMTGSKKKKKGKKATTTSASESSSSSSRKKKASKNGGEDDDMPTLSSTNNITSNIIVSTATTNDGSDDAHLIMATTHAINILLEQLLSLQRGSKSNPIAAPAKTTTTMKDDDDDDDEDRTVTSSSSSYSIAIMLIQLSSSLMTCLVIDRNMLENITKAKSSRPIIASTAASSGTSPAGAATSSQRAVEGGGGGGGEASYFSCLETDDEMNVTSDNNGNVGTTARLPTSTVTSSSISPASGATATGAIAGGTMTAETKRIMMSHAKSIVGRALTSCVMGTLYGLETLGKSRPNNVFYNSNGNSSNGDAGVDNSPLLLLLRQCLWSGLLTLEMAFQLTPKPKLLATSSLLSTTSLPATTTGTAATMSSSSSMYDPFSTTMSAVGGGSGGGGAAAADHINLSSSAVGHAHLTMGADTIAMWDSLLGCILTNYYDNIPGSTTIQGGGNNVAQSDQHLAQLCQDVTEIVFSKKEENSKLILFVLEEYSNNNKIVENKSISDDGSSGNPPKKTRKTSSTSTASGSRKKGSSSKNNMTEMNYETSAKDYSKLSSLLSTRKENHISFDCHVSIRRWAVLTFGWLCSGQRRMLEMGTEMLRNAEAWENVFDLTTTTDVIMGDRSSTAATERSPPEAVTAPPVDTAKKRKKTKKEIVKSAIISTKLMPQLDMITSVSRSSSRDVSGSLALVIFVSVMVDTVHDAGATGGLSPPSFGWMDEYVKAVIGDGAVVGNKDDDKSNDSKPRSKVATTSAETTKVAAPPDTRRSSRKRSQPTQSSDMDMRGNIPTTDTSPPRGGGGSSGSPKRGSNPQVVWIRPDIRNVTSVLAKLLIECHYKSLCLDDNLTSDGGGSSKKGVFLVNDDDTFFGPTMRRRTIASNQKEQFSSNSFPKFYYPFMHRTIKTLARAAASSAFLVSSNDGNGITIAISSAVALGCFSQNYKKGQEDHVNVAFDAKLLSMAVFELVECLRRLLSGVAKTGTSAAASSTTIALAELPHDVMMTYRLNDPLDVIAENVQFVDAASSSLSEKTNPADILALFIRAQIPFINTASSESVSCSNATSSLLQTLVDIIQLCYDFDLEKDLHIDNNAVSGELSTTAKKKKRKANFMTSVLETLGPEIRPKTTYTQCVLASDALQALIHSLTYVAKSTVSILAICDKAESSAHSIRLFFRGCFSMDMVLQIVRLGYNLEENLVRRRLDIAKNEFNTGISGLKSSSDNLFEPWERQLWVCHIQLSLMIGSGGGLGVGNTRNIEELFLGIITVESQRSQRIGSSYTSITISGSKPINPEDHYLWPLNREYINFGWLHIFSSQILAEVLTHFPYILRTVSAAQHALVSQVIVFFSNVTRQSDVPSVAIQLLCNAFLNRLGHFIGGLSNPPKISEFIVTTSDEFLLSLRDARLFALAVSILPEVSQKAIMSRLIGILHKGMQLYHVYNNGETGFIARAIILCACIVDLVLRPDLAKLLVKEVEASNYSLPRLKVQDQSEDDQTRAIFSNESFQSIFAVWQSPLCPNTGSSFEMLSNPVSQVIENKNDDKAMSAVILMAFTLGFESASNDGCHLLLSAWNAAAKLSSWRSQTWDGPTSATVLKSLSVEERIMKTRVDMCELHNLDDPSYNDSASPHRRKENLLRGLSSAEKMLAFLIKEAGKKSLVTSAMFAYYEALPIFVSFIISMHCRPGLNDMGFRWEQKGASSSRGSPPKTSRDRFLVDSDLEIYDTTTAGGSISRMNALTRLHEACLVIGAAPCYPDWLDTNCRLRNDILPSVAVDSANRALLSLTALGMEIWKSYLDAMRQVLDVLNQAGNTTIKGGESIAVQLFFAQQKHPTDLSESYYSKVASLCGIDASVYSTLFISLSSEQRLAGDALVANSAHQILGANLFKSWKVFPGERRANGQWELMLSEVLQASSLKIRSSTIASEPVLDTLASVHRWRRVLVSIVNAMVPVSALLRFGINEGKGQPTHSLCEDKPTPGSIFSSSSGRSPEKMLKFNEKSGEAIGVAVKDALSFLACVAAHSSHDEDIRLTSRAAATHLMENSSDFNDLVSLWSAMTCCHAVGDLMQWLKNETDERMSESQKSLAYAIMETTLTQFADTPGEEIDDDGMNIIALDESLDIDKKMVLLSCLGVKKLKVGKIIGSRTELELTLMMSKSPKIDPTRLLLSLLLEQGLSFRSRIFSTEILNDLCSPLSGTTSGDTNDVLAAVATLLDELSEDDVRQLTKNLLCNTNNPSEESLILSVKSAALISHIACCAPHGITTGKGCKIIFDEMLDCMDKWARSSTQHHLMRLLCLLASRFCSLDAAGSGIVSLLKENQKGSNDAAHECIETAKVFFESVARLDRSINNFSASAAATVDSVASPNNVSVTLKTGKVVSKMCSFIETGEGFTEQHWYNCYTCGLLWDKGCCALCARVCHKGHDVGYSRKSSFFCDCGAEVATAIEQNRTPCKCLVPVTDEDTVRDIYQSEAIKEAKSIEPAHEDSDAFTKVMVKHFSSECKESLKNMVTEALKSDWRDSILLIFNQHYQAKSSSSSNFTDISDILSGTSATQPITGPNLRPKSGQPLTITRSGGTCPMLPIRAAKASTLQSRMISSSSSSMRKARNDSHVQIIAADNRGRLFVAESTSVLFCSSIPSVNVRHVDNSPASHLSRAQLNILGTDSVKFFITGMVVNSVNNRHLLLWGVSKACVAIVSKNFGSFERIIDLKLNLEPSEECEHIVKCDWMPQSELQVVAVCGAVVHVFDLKRAENNTCNATTHYALAYEDVLIRSATLVGSLMVDDGSVIDTKLALLLDTGRLYFISLTIDEEGNLEDHGESYIEIGAGLSFPSAGIRRYSGGEPGVLGATATTFGEGVYLAYLRQANLLLYQCVSSCCIAMLLDEDGAICGSFELLPNMIAADELGGHYGVLGPYTHFQELGTVTRDKDLFYRVACVGRSTRSNQPMALILEFNANHVYVRELSWPSSCSAGLGFISSYNFVGSCTFSCPYLLSDDASGTSKEGRVHERAFLTLLSSSGSLLWFGEDCQHLHGAGTDSTRQALQHQVPKIGYFEQLINASELEALTYGGDFAGKDPKTIKRKLSLNNTDYVICPSCAGCTLTASLQDQSLAIVAVRILVGSMPDMIPKEVIVMGSGRSMKLKLSMKRWYDYILTEEEILLAVRNGFVTIWISSCHVDSSSAPIIDSVEVYARARSELAHLSPVSDGNSKEESLLNSMKRSVQEQNSNLVAYIQTLTCLTQITGRTKTSPLSSESKETISNIIQQTALESAEEGSLRHQTIEFLSEAEGDIEKRTYLIDEATLSGIMSLLQNLTKYLQTEYEDSDIISSKEEVTINRAIEMLIIILSSTITIARVRGSNYMDIISSLIEKNSWQTSLALEGKRILDLLQYFKAMLGANLNLFQPAQLVSELMLLELACSTAAHVTVPLNCITQFDTLSEYLVVDSFEIIKACCAAISTAIGSADTKRSGTLSIPSSERELSGEGGGIITYQCDSCLVFPITSQRFTLGGEADIDLCKRCYDSGMEYSKSHGQTDPIIINGRTLGLGNEDMKCGTIWRMVSKPIAESSALSAENAKKAGLALKTMGSSDNKRGDDINLAKTEGFKSHLFTKLLGLMTKSFDARSTTEESSPPSVYVLQLILDVVLGSCTEELKVARGKEMALAFTQNLARLVKLCQTSDSKFSQHCSKLVVSLRTLAGLVRQNREIIHVPLLFATSDDEKDGVNMLHSNHKSKTDPRFVCEHEMPAVRRRCSHGVHKDRRFYVCGLDRSKRCNYFKWSDDTGPVSPSQNVNQLVSHNEQIFAPVQMELQRIFSSTSLQEQFASLVSNQFETNQGAIATAQINEGASNLLFTSIITDVERAQDKEDGVFLALEKFGILKPIPSHSISGDLSSVDDGAKDSFLSSSLNLFSLIAPTTGSSKWCHVWFSVLCEIISRSSASSMETSTTVVRLARSMLQRLCGDRIEVYHRVRDHYVFGIQFRKLFQRAQDILDSALIVREQARQCGRSWREEEVMFDSLPASGLLGVEDLISEDEYTTSTEANIGTVLDELLSAAVRVSSWRKFCGLPGFNVAKSTAAENFEGGLYMLDQIYHRPPIVSLMWLSSSLRGSNQVKALSLLEIALSDETSPASVVNLPPDDIDGLLTGGHKTLDTCPSCPELCLHKCFTVNDLIAFVKQFVLNGRSKQLRAVAAKVTRKLANQLSVSDKQHLVSCLIKGPFQQVGAYGIVSKNFIELLIMIVDSFGSDLDLSSLSLCIAESFISQMTVLNERFSSKSDNEMDVIICNLSNCVHCQRQMPKKTTKFNTKKPDSSGKVTTSDVVQGMILPDQVRPYQRGRLESSVNASVSSEFSSHNQLKFRIALSQIHVTVSDPRGRLVKSIGVYYSPRQVSDVNVLKSDKYTNIWQRCGTLTLSRGATEATCKLTTPVIVANLKFIYEDFFEKASNKRASDGSFILYCPRCTRQVNNAHGVCGSCGEVAFQCRKCRHINYDSLDAFLCVECGYCTAGSFTYELTAGIALNATAILDEDGFQRSMAMLRVANKRQSDLRTSLKKRATVGKNCDYMENLDEMVLYGPHLKRALLGYMPKSEGADDEDETNKKSGSKGTKGSSAERASSSSSRARSLLSLARSLRADGGEGFSSRGDLLRQALLSAGSGPGGLDSADASDLLNALSANINARTRDESGTGATTGGSGDGGKNDDKTKLTPAEERNRLYSQMREAERECYELNRRIDAWNRLNNDCLTGSNAPTTVQFMPSTCFTCSSALAYQILLLLCSVYATANAQFECTITSHLIKILFKESVGANPKMKDLNNLQRQVIVTLASTKFVELADTVLEELKLRLNAVQDVTSAEILGTLIQLDFPSRNKFVELADTVLEELFFPQSTIGRC